jgi:hypothetical protein
MKALIQKPKHEDTYCKQLILINELINMPMQLGWLNEKRIFGFILTTNGMPHTRLIIR